MRVWERWSFNVLSLIVAATGFAYFWMKYVLVTDDPFAVVNHAWQPLMLSLHVVASPALLLIFGIIFNSHIMKKIGARHVPNRLSGLISLGTFGTMTVTGYLLQVLTVDSALTALVVLHVASGVLFSLVYAAHLLISLKLARRQDARRLQHAAA